MKLQSKFLFFLILFPAFHLIAQESQSFNFHIRRVLETLDNMGNPIDENNRTAIIKAIESQQSPDIIQADLEKYVLFNVTINPESRVVVKSGSAKPELLQSGWKTFLVKVTNQAGVTAKLEANSKQATRVYDGGEKIYGMAGAGKGTTVSQADINDRWLDLALYTEVPMKPILSGLVTEYFIIQLYSRDAGKRTAGFSFHCGEGTQDIGFRNETDVTFNCLPSYKIKLEVIDENEKPTTGSFIIRDHQGHIYPSQAKRLAPDFFFQQQIYRANNETIDLPKGNYTVIYGRGPEYLKREMDFEVTGKPGQVLKIALQRWIEPSAFKWYSGDHHIHAAGCAHYTSPTQGVNPEDMFRHLVGEAVNVGSVLTWGPGYAHQKQFFEGKDNKLSTKENVLRYDLEISGFPSSHSGHLVLLRLKDQDYPGANDIEDWPSYTIPVLKWAKSQGAVTGYAHAGFGLQTVTDALPNYEMPKFDGIGANEYIVSVTQNLVDFISVMDTPPAWELNIWYHTLNCGFRTRIGGETDFPCITDDVVAHGRSYVKLDGKLNFNDWAESLKQGRCYTSEGKSHIMDFKVNDVEVGTKDSEVRLKGPSKVKVSAKVAARLEENIDPAIRPLNTNENVWLQKPFWNIERGRIRQTRTIAVELIVNGESVANKAILADGGLQDISFDVQVDKSSWIALRILPSSHSNPIFVMIDDKPIRANKKSAEWCLNAVDVCWKQKEGLIKESEKAAAKADYENAKKVYAEIIAGSTE